jgi:hypothetical protein
MARGGLLVQWLALAVTTIAVAGCEAISFPRPTVIKEGLLKDISPITSGTTAGTYWEARAAWFGREWCMGVATATHGAGACEEPPDPRTPLRVILEDDKIAFLYGVVLDEAVDVSVRFGDGRTVKAQFYEGTGPVDFWILPLAAADRDQAAVVEAFDAAGGTLADEEVRTP